MKRKKLLWIVPFLVVAALAALWFMRDKPTLIVGAEYKGFSPGERPSVIFITVDNLRADSLGLYGNWDAKTPVIDALGANGAFFTHFFHSTPMYLPNVVTLFTALYPPNHGVRDGHHFRLPDSFTVISEIFQKAGYRSDAFLGSGQFGKRFNLSQGFDSYDDSLVGPKGVQQDYFLQFLSAAKLNKKIFERLEAETGKNPFFLWVQYSDLREPYSKPEEKTATDDPYGEAVAKLDKEIGKLIEFLKKKGLDRKTLIILTSTKPENLGEHKLRIATTGLYDENLKAPLIFSHPGAFRGRTQVDALTASVDVLPSVVEMLKMDTSGLLFDGRSFVPILEKSAEFAGRDAIYIETFFPYSLNGSPVMRGVRARDSKLVRQGAREVFFNLAEDKMELKAFKQEEFEGALFLRGKLDEFEADFSWEPMKKAYAAGRLRSREYAGIFKRLTGLAFRDRFFAAYKAQESFDPQTQVDFFVSLSKGKAKTYPQVLAEIGKQIQKNPYNRNYRLLLGQIFGLSPTTRSGLFDELFQIVTHDPMNWLFYQSLAGVYERWEMKDKIKDLWLLMHAVNLEEDFPIRMLLSIYLGEGEWGKAGKMADAMADVSVYRASGLWASLTAEAVKRQRLSVAIEFADRALALNPNNLIARHIRGSLRLHHGHFDAGVGDFLQIKEADPEWFEHLFFRQVLFYAMSKKDPEMSQKLLVELDKNAQDRFYPEAAAVLVQKIRTGDNAAATDGLSALLKKKWKDWQKILLLELLGDIHQSQNDSEGAAGYYRQALEMNPYLPIIANNYAWIVGRDDKKREEAFGWIFKALSRAPANPMILDTLAELYFLDKKPVYALRVQREVWRKMMNVPVVREHFEKYRREVKRIYYADRDAYLAKLKERAEKREREALEDKKRRRKRKPIPEIPVSV